MGLFWVSMKHVVLSLMCVELQRAYCFQTQAVLEVKRPAGYLRGVSKISVLDHCSMVLFEARGVFERLFSLSLSYVPLCFVNSRCHDHVRDAGTP
jgi:hypothetical protein